jgi:hypothetical protein
MEILWDPIEIRWQVYGNSKETPEKSTEIILWKSYGNLMGILWKSYENRMGLYRNPNGNL